MRNGACTALRSRHIPLPPRARRAAKLPICIVPRTGRLTTRERTACPGDNVVTVVRSRVVSLPVLGTGASNERHGQVAPNTLIASVHSSSP